MTHQPTIWYFSKRLTVLVILIIQVVLSTACTSQRDPINPPPIAFDCQNKDNWQGIIPGVTTKREVVEILGKPDKESIVERDGLSILVLEYDINSGIVAEYAKDKIYFKEDDVVLWIEEIVADRDGKFVPISMEIEKYGKLVNTVYENNNYVPGSNQFDILAGPDQVYVWSTCGIAVVTMSHCFVTDKSDFDCLSEQVAETRLLEDRVEQIRPTQAQLDSSFPATQNVELMRVRFVPTSYEEFNKFYRYKIPYGIWNDYSREVVSPKS